MGGWLESDNRAISVQLNLTGTATETELGKKSFCICIVVHTECGQLKKYQKLNISQAIKPFHLRDTQLTTINCISLAALKKKIVCPT